MSRKARTRWESHCNRCGLCCYEKVRHSDGSWTLDLSRPCPWLDRETRQCRIYERRLKVYPRCRRVGLFVALFAPFLPPSCGYVRNIRPRFFPKPRLILEDSPDARDREEEER